MRETDDNQLISSSLIKINYDKRFIRIAQDFIENLSLLVGANKSESFQISMLIEECLVFIIDKYIDCRMAAHIQICFMVSSDKKICVEITDMGPPVHEKMIPTFDIANENSEAGIWYKLAKGLSDKFVFINKFGFGWLIQFEKNIEDMTFRTNGDDAHENIPLVGVEHTSGEKQIRAATADDVPKLIDLAYMTYRYSYMFKDFYDGELLKKHIDQKLNDIMLVEHGSKVIGAYAIKYSDANHIFAEVGNAMILPEYRDASAMRLVMRELNIYVKTNPRHCEFFVSSAVTSHVRSQKGLSRIHNGFKPLMISLNTIPRPEFIGIDHKGGGRESGLHVYHLNDTLKMEKLYCAAACHLQIINELIVFSGNEIEVLTKFSEPENIESQISVNQIDYLQLATISIESIGLDWFTSLNKIIYAAIISGVESILVMIPTSAPLPSHMERMLTDLNLVFCGISLRSLKEINLAYCFTIKPIDFNHIKLYEPVAQKLLTHIQQSYSEHIKLA